MLKLILLSAMLMLAFCRSQYKAIDNSCNSTSCRFTLAYTGTEDYYKTPKSPIIKKLQVQFSALTYADFNIKITDFNNPKRFQVLQGNGFPQDPYRNFSFPSASAAYTFSYTLDPFDFRFARKQNNNTLFSTYEQDLIFSQYYLQIGTQIQNDFIYGLGERFSANFRVKDGKWTIFNRDHPFQIDYGTGQQTYGYYPYYLNRERYNKFHVAYFRSSNAMDVIKQTKEGKTSLVYKVIGGIIDLRFMLGDDDPVETLIKMTEYAGKSNIPPFWALGFHQCRWGYENSSMLLDVLANYEKYGIPLDTIWSDIDYMQDFQDFTIDEENFPLSDMKKIKQNYRYIPIIDAGIKVEGIAYDEGLKRNVFINDALGKPFVGAVWPGDTTFVDFLHPNASKYWGDMLSILYQKVQFDGVWLDMNELSNFCNGPCSTPMTEKIFDYSNDLPYQPGKNKIQDSTIPLNCTHYQGYKEADVHIYHSLLQTKATNEFLQSKNLRPFIVSRSSTIGSSKYGNHWTGDNAATWQFLQSSIVNIFNSHINGFKMVGEDICGFGGNTTVELCARWFQLGALYPFSRNHNAYGAESQEPYAMGDVVLQAAKKAIKLRYSLLKFYFTLMLVNDQSHIWTPLFFEFPQDDKVYSDAIADTTFLLGDSVLVAPILKEGVTKRSVYFPKGNWYDMFSGEKYLGNRNYTVDCNLTDTVPIFILEHFTVLVQNVNEVRNTKQLNNIFTAYSAFDLVGESGDVKLYQSDAVILSFNDYNNETQLGSCIKAGNCYFVVNFDFKVYKNKKVLVISNIPKPSPYSEQLFIDGINIYFDGQVIRYTPENKIRIAKDSGTTTIVIEQTEQQEKNEQGPVHLTLQ